MKKLLSLFTALIISISAFSQSSEFEISKNLETFSSVYKTLFENYVDDINTGELMRIGIDAMLESLDPYTEFKSESEVEDFRFMATGQYGGIGSLIQQQENKVIISEPYKDSPADKAGLKAGDIIIKIDSKDVSGKSSSDISELLKGEPGTKLTVTVERFNQKKPVEISLTREKINVPNIPYYEIKNNSIGYIYLNSFTNDASKDFINAYNELKKEAKLTGLIIDLRNNGGGLLPEAVKIMNMFVPAGELIVNTKGRVASKNSIHKTTTNPIDTDIPIVVLVNGTSASASEILAGAMQDLDRGVIIGDRTFGKGLVQNILPTAFNSQMKITVAKYYIPSGRCVQAIDYSHKDESGKWTKLPDSLMTKFHTRNGRVVWDGAGIQPDIQIDHEMLSEVTANLIIKNHIFNFATQYYYNHQNDIIDPKTFQITDDIWSQFINYLSEKDFTYTSTAEKQFEKLETVLKEENYYDDLKKQMDELSRGISIQKDSDLANSREQISYYLGSEIASRYHYSLGRLLFSQHSDEDVEAALELLNDKEKYNKTLAPPK
ncbi:MAG: S41 family peptidase [Bacteroidales bacterium]|jgi:carboxyl-terminal processing protease|nr:S41 family peptidase [Bacteroidales bacterium]